MKTVKVPVVIRTQRGSDEKNSRNSHLAVNGKSNSKGGGSTQRSSQPHQRRELLNFEAIFLNEMKEERLRQETSDSSSATDARQKTASSLERIETYQEDGIEEVLEDEAIAIYGELDGTNGLSRTALDESRRGQGAQTTMSARAQQKNNPHYRYK